MSPPEHGKLTNCPFTHCANAPWIHALSPAWHGVFALSVANFAFSAWASRPFCSVNAARRSDMGVALAARAKARTEMAAAMRDMMVGTEKGGKVGATGHGEKDTNVGERKSNQALSR